MASRTTLGIPSQSDARTSKSADLRSQEHRCARPSQWTRPASAESSAVRRCSSSAPGRHPPSRVPVGAMGDDQFGCVEQVPDPFARPSGQDSGQVARRRARRSDARGQGGRHVVGRGSMPFENDDQPRRVDSADVPKMLEDPLRNTDRPQRQSCRPAFEFQMPAFLAARPRESHRRARSPPQTPRQTATRSFAWNKKLWTSRGDRALSRPSQPSHRPKRSSAIDVETHPGPGSPPPEAARPEPPRPRARSPRAASAAGPAPWPRSDQEHAPPRRRRGR